MADIEITEEYIEKLEEKLLALRHEFAADSAEAAMLREALRGIEDGTSSASDAVLAAAGALDTLTERVRDTTDATRALERGTERLIRTLTGVTKTTDGVFASFTKMAFGSEGFAKAQETAAKALDETLTGANIAIAVFKKFVEGTSVLTLSVDNATSAFAKASGTGAKYTSVIQAAEYRNRHLGVSATEAQAATGALLGGFSEFLMMSEDAQKTLVATVAEFETWGVAAGTTTKFLEGVTRTTGRTRHQALRLQKSIMGTAKAFGDDLNKVMEEAATVMPKLAIHGQNLEEVLDDLYSASKRTGMGMSEIVDLSTQFDTFEAAADAAGNLNAVLGQMGGGPIVDTMQILETTNPAERMQLFADAIEQSVGNFENLGYHQQAAVAKAMGMTVEQTRQLVLQEKQETAMSAALSKRGLSEENILEMQAQGRDLMTEMKILAMSFALSLQFPLDMLKGFIGLLNSGLKHLRDMGDALDSLGMTATVIKGIAMLGVCVRRQRNTPRDFSQTSP